MTVKKEEIRSQRMVQSAQRRRRQQRRRQQRRRLEIGLCDDTQKRAEEGSSVTGRLDDYVFNIWSPTIINICPTAQIICPNMFKMLPNTILALSKWPKILKNFVTVAKFCQIRSQLREEKWFHSRQIFLFENIFLKSGFQSSKARHLGPTWVPNLINAEW